MIKDFLNSIKVKFETKTASKKPKIHIILNLLQKLKEAESNLKKEK